MSHKITLHATNNEPVKVPCQQCNCVTNHEVITAVSSRWDEEYLCMDTDYQVIKCCGCDGISYRTSSTSSEEIGCDPTTGESWYHETEELYPHRTVGRKQIQDIPYPLTRIYEETFRALCGNSRILAGTGIRILVELICKDRGAKGRDLEIKIDDLVKQGILTSVDAETLQSTRILGNQSAHEARPPTNDEINVAMDIVENLIQRVYILPERAVSLPKRKQVAVSVQAGV